MEILNGVLKMSILDPLSCGVAKVALVNILTTKFVNPNEKETKKVYQGRLLRCQYETFNNYFGNRESFTVGYKKFKDKFPSIITKIRDVGKRNVDQKNFLLNVFSEESWKDLPGEKKQKHSLFDCKECFNNATYKEALVIISFKNAKKFKESETKLMKDKILLDITASKVNELNQEFKNNYNVTFTKLYNKQFNSHSQEKNPENSQKIVKAAFKNCEEQWQQSSIER